MNTTFYFLSKIKFTYQQQFKELFNKSQTFKKHTRIQNDSILVNDMAFILGIKYNKDC